MATKQETFVIEDAVRETSWGRICLAAAPGGGKTASALRMACGMAQVMLEQKKIASLDRIIGVVDTEHRSAQLYQDRMWLDGRRAPPFKVINLEPPYTTERYIGAGEALLNAGFKIIIIDQISHAWAGQGGLLEKKNELAKTADYNDFTAFAEITPIQNRFIETLLSFPAHLILTMRQHQKYVLEQYENAQGKTKQRPKRVGMAPIQREGVEYEFTTVLNLDVDGNKATVNKDRSLFGPPGTALGILREEHGQALAEWLYTGRNTLTDAIATPGQKLAALVQVVINEMQGCTTLPDLARIFGKAQKDIRAVDGGGHNTAMALEKITIVKDARKGVLAPEIHAPAPGVELITPDEVDALEQALKSIPISMHEVQTKFDIPRLSHLPKVKLADVKDWIDAERVLRGAMPAPKGGAKQQELAERSHAALEIDRSDAGLPPFNHNLIR